MSKDQKVQEREQLIAEMTALERSIANLPEHCVIDRMSLEARLSKIMGIIKGEKHE